VARANGGVHTDLLNLRGEDRSDRTLPDLSAIAIANVIGMVRSNGQLELVAGKPPHPAQHHP
jgi:hypothetical protein